MPHYFPLARKRLVIIPLLSLLLATLLSSQFGASLLHPQKVQAAIPSPDGTTLLMIHGFNDTCQFAFNEPDLSASTGSSNTTTSAYLKQHGWTSTDQIGYYDPNHIFPFKLANGNDGSSTDGTSTTDGTGSLCNHNLFTYGTGPGDNADYAQDSSACTTIADKYGIPNYEYGTTDDPIEHLACQFAWYIYDVYTLAHHPVDILAHSMGGLITRTAIGESHVNNAPFPPAWLDVRRVVTVGTPHGGLTGQYQADADTYTSGPDNHIVQEVQDMTVNSGFMNMVSALQAPQGQYGTYWALMASSVIGDDQTSLCLSTPGTDWVSCKAEFDSQNQPYPDGDGAVQASSALAMRANFKILYGAVYLPYTVGTPIYSSNSGYSHEANSCAPTLPFLQSFACLGFPFFLNDGTLSNQNGTTAWVCFHDCNSSDSTALADTNPSNDAIPALNSLAEIVALLAPPNMFTYAANNADGRLEVFARGSDHNIWHIWQTCPYCGWSSWSALQSGYTFNGDPAVGQELDGRLAVFARGSNNAIWVNRQTSPNSGWTGWSVLSQSYGFQGTPAVGRNQDGRLEIFAHGSDGNIWHNWQKTAGDDSSWNGWVPLQSGKVLKGDPVVGINSDGTLEVFAQSTDGNIAHNRQVQPSGSWSGWSGLQSGQSFLGRLSVGRNLDGRLEVYALDWNNNVVHNYQLTGGGWSGWVPLQSQTSHIFNSTAAVGNNADGRLEVFATENAYAEMWHNRQTSPNGSWNGWANLQSGFGFVGANPATANTYDGRLEVFAFGRDNNLWHNFVQVGGGWSGWQPLQSGSSFTPSDCHNTPSDELCDNGFYTNETCPDSQQLETASNPYVSVTIHWSNNCQTNWTSAQILYSQYSLYKVDIERQGNTSDGALTYTDYPGTATWYTNMIWSPNNPVRSCAWYFDPNYARVYGPVCTGWH